MVHHTEWDRRANQRGGFMQKDHNEMEQIIKEMAPGGKHHHPFKDGSVKTDSQIHHEGSETRVAYRGVDYDHSLPSLYRGQWYQSSYSLFTTAVKIILFILIAFCLMQLVRLAAKNMRIYPKSLYSSKKSSKKSK